MNKRYSVVAISPCNVNNIITQWFKTGDEAGEYACNMSEGGFRCIVMDNHDMMCQVYMERDIYEDLPLSERPFMPGAEEDACAGERL